MKKILTLVAALSLVASLAVGGSIAYLSDTDKEVNVMTLGNVDIEMHEYERVVEKGNYTTKEIDGQTSYVLKNFSQGKPLLPIVGDPSLPGNDAGYAGWDKSATVRMSQVDSYGGMNVFAGKNAQDKFVTVENTGRTDAYVRTIVAIEIGSADMDLIGTSYHGAWDRTEPVKVTIDGNNYAVIAYTYKGATLSDGTVRHENGVLPAGDTTYPNLAQIYLKAKATNEDCEKIDGNGNGTLDILVLSQAIQAAGFADAETALKAAFGDVTAATVQAWFAGMGDFKFIAADTQKAAIEGEAAAEILVDLQNGENLIADNKVDIIQLDTNELNAKGATVTMSGTGPDAYGYLAVIPDAGEDATVSNLNVTGSGFVEVGHYGMGGGNYTLDNVKIENLAATLANGDKGFTLGCAFMGFGDTTLDNCVIKGTTAVQDGVMPVDLACGQAWSGYTDDDDNKISTTVNGGEYGTVYCWSKSIVTINGAKVDTMYVAPSEGSVKITGNAVIDTINVDYGTGNATQAKLQKLVIENGAIVNKIVYDGNTYTVDTWNTYVASL